MGFLKTKGEKVFFVLFLAFVCAGAALLAAIFVLQVGDVNMKTITLSGTDTVKVNNNRILVRSAASSGGYYIYDNATLAQLGSVHYSTGWSTYHRFFLVGNLVYGTSAFPLGNMGTVEQWSTSNPSTVTANTSIGFSAAADGVCVQGTFAYFGLANQTVAIVDCSAAPSALVLLNVTSTMGFVPSKLLVNGGFLYSGGFGLSVTNVSVIGQLGTPQRKLGLVRDFVIRNNYLYAVGSAGNLSIHDISSPLSPVQVGWLNVSQSVSDLMGICVTTRGSQVLALIRASESSGLYVVDVTNPATPVLLGVKMVKTGGASANLQDVAVDAERVYVANGQGICIYSKESLNAFNLSPAYQTQSLGEILVSICIVLLSICPFWGSGFLWMRSKRVARSQSKDLWITPGVVTRTIILFCMIIPIDMALSPLVGMDIYSFIVYDLYPMGIASAIPLLMYWRQRRLGKGGEAGLSKEQLLERLKAEKDARARAEEETHRKSDQERKKREEEKASKQQAKEDAKRRQAEEETRKKTEQEEARMRKLQQIVKVSARLPIDRIAQMLEMDSEEVWKRVLDWAERFHFTIDGQDLIFNKETVNDFITSLDKEFKQWGKDGKV